LISRIKFSITFPHQDISYYIFILFIKN